MKLNLAEWKPSEIVSKYQVLVAKISKWAKRSKSLCISLLLRSGGSLTVGD
ncbi:hypothetical protein HPP92_023497 [Vanilla planifolia]|uniref:Uncharacterized protein n=1 Tax=Vanilla planifolia TaxID=51239 RepID=A0A835PTG8_VANPL|nr:hypothetical protein HPP92_023497 [Vanilla planifolia]